jgi:hypothetical protein
MWMPPSRVFVLAVRVGWHSAAFLTRPSYLCSTLFNVMHTTAANANLFPVMAAFVSLPSMRISSFIARAGHGA